MSFKGTTNPVPVDCRTTAAVPMAKTPARNTVGMVSSTPRQRKATVNTANPSAETKQQYRRRCVAAARAIDSAWLDAEIWESPAPPAGNQNDIQKIAINKSSALFAQHFSILRELRNYCQ